MNFEAYLENKNPEHHEVLRLSHDVILAAHPAMQLVRKWGLPVFMLKKNVAYLDVQKNRPLLGIMYMKDIPGMDKLTYVGKRTHIGHFYLDNMDDARYSELLAVVEIAVTHDLNR